MYGLIVKLAAVSGKREQLISLLAGCTKEMPGCFSYVVAKDTKDESGIWVTEVWDSEASHDASLLIPEVKETVAQAKPMVAHFEKIAVTTPVAGVGFSS
jgi:quinol monooxygenase YgiN